MNNNIISNYFHELVRNVILKKANLNKKIYLPIFITPLVMNNLVTPFPYTHLTKTTTITTSFSFFSSSSSSTPIDNNPAPGSPKSTLAQAHDTKKENDKTLFENVTSRYETFPGDDEEGGGGGGGGDDDEGNGENGDDA